MGIIDISQSSEKEFADFLDSFDTVLTDCDGVIWLLGEPLNGSLDAIRAFEALGKRVFYVSNNATRTVPQYVTTMKAFNFNITESQVVTPAVSVVQLLRDRGVTGKVHLLASSAFRSDLEAAGVCCTDRSPPKEINYQTIISHLRNFVTDVGAFVLDFSANLTYLELLEAAALLENPDCLFIVGATDYDVPVARDLNLLGPGYFIDMLKKASGREPLVAGKPSTVIKQVVKARHPTMDPKRTLFIGDSLPQDIRQGVASGFITLLVLSGISKLEDAEDAPSTRRPQYVAPSLKALLPALNRFILASGQYSNGNEDFNNHFNDLN